VAKGLVRRMLGESIAEVFRDCSQHIECSGGGGKVRFDACRGSRRYGLGGTRFGKADIFQVAQKVLQLPPHHAEIAQALMRKHCICLMRVGQLPAQTRMRLRVGISQTALFQFAQQPIDRAHACGGVMFTRSLQ